MAIFQWPFINRRIKTLTYWEYTMSLHLHIYTSSLDFIYASFLSLEVEHNLVEVSLARSCYEAVEQWVGQAIEAGDYYGYFVGIK